MKTVTLDQLKLGDLVDGQYGLCQVVKITDKQVQFQGFYIPGNNFDHFRTMGLTNARISGSEWDGQLTVPLAGNEQHFKLGRIYSERKEISRGGRTRANQALLLTTAKEQVYRKDFYLN